MSVETELGMLIVVVLKARNLIDKHSFYKQDVFAQISLNRTELQTPVVIKGGQHPVWDAELRVPVMRNPTDKSRTLLLSCWSKEHKRNDLLGELMFSLTQYCPLIWLSSRRRESGYFRNIKNQRV
jgi:Ca2+-dependent lipid-binding protein